MIIHIVINERAQHEALHSIEMELGEAEPRLQELQVRVMDLRRAADSLRSLLNLPTQETRPLATLHAGERPRAPQNRGSLQGVSAGRGPSLESSSTDRVIQILIERAGETTRAEIAQEFELRGWTVDWKEPEAALRMAIRRANERDGVVAVGPGSFAYMPALDPAARSALQRRMSERRMRREAQMGTNRIHETQVSSSPNAEMTSRPDGDRGEGARETDPN